MDWLDWFDAHDYEIARQVLQRGVGALAFVAFLSTLVNRQHTATQYALLSSMVNLPGKVLGLFAGGIVESTNLRALGKKIEGFVGINRYLPILEGPLDTPAHRKFFEVASARRDLRANRPRPGKRPAAAGGASRAG